MQFAQVEDAIDKVEVLFPALRDSGSSLSPTTPNPRLSADNWRIAKRIMQVYNDMMKLDKKKWQHKPVHSYAWASYMAGDLEHAKSLMLQLTQVKSPSKAFKSIWKTEFERPGGYFVYNNKYCKFLMDLAVQTEDFGLLVVMCQRLNKDDTLYKRQALFQEAKKNLTTILEKLHPEASTAFEGLCETGDHSELLATEQQILQDTVILPTLIVACELKRLRILELDALIIGLYSLLQLKHAKSTKVNKMDDNHKTKLTQKVLSRALAMTRNLETKKD